MTRPGVNPKAQWRRNLLQAPEWAELVADYRRAMVVRALSGSADAGVLYEVSRDLKGVSAFLLWIENDVTQSGKAGNHGRAKREAGNIAGAGDGASGADGDGRAG